MKVIRLQFDRLSPHNGWAVCKPEGKSTEAPSVHINRTFQQQHLQDLDLKDAELVLVVGRRDG